MRSAATRVGDTVHSLVTVNQLTVGQTGIITCVVIGTIPITAFSLSLFPKPVLPLP